MRIREYEQYKFQNFVKTGESKYIYQFITNRTLTTIPHTHDFYEICYVARGHCTEMHSGKKLRIDEGKMSVIIPDRPHYFTDQSDDLVLICLSVHKEEFLKIADTMESGLANYLLETSDDQTYDTFGKAPGNIYRNPYIKSQNDFDYKYLLSFFVMNLSKNKFHSGDASDSDFCALITRLPATEIIIGGVPTLVKLTNYSRTQLTRLMKQHLDKTPWEYVTELRMNYAYNRLVFTDEGIEDISEKCGFSSFSHFSQGFKRWYGETPSALRKRHLNSTV